MANAIFHTYKLDEYGELFREIPISRICSLYKIVCDETSKKYISTLLTEILDEPIAVINKTLNHKLIKWEIYNLFTIIEPITAETEIIKLKINPHYLTITQKFVVNPYLEF